MNGGFGMLIDGSEDSERRLRSMLDWDVKMGSRAGVSLKRGCQAIDRAMEMEPRLKVTRANYADDDLIAGALSDLWRKSNVLQFFRFLCAHRDAVLRPHVAEHKPADTRGATRNGRARP